MYWIIAIILLLPITYVIYRAMTKDEAVDGSLWAMVGVLSVVLTAMWPLTVLVIASLFGVKQIENVRLKNVRRDK